MSNFENIGDRMKAYEDASRVYLARKLPVIIRLDGKAFHTWTRGASRPYDANLMIAMNKVMVHLCSNVQNTVIGYTQSDEISLLLVDYKTPKTASWFDSNLQKMVSVAASMASAKLTMLSETIFNKTKEAYFDARAFVLPEQELKNYFQWRQQDWNRNSLAMLAQSLYSHKELAGKNQAAQHEMCMEKGVNWSALPSHLKDGRVCIKRTVERPVARTGNDGSATNTTCFRREWHIPEETPRFNIMSNLSFQIYTDTLKTWAETTPEFFKDEPK